MSACPVCNGLTTLQENCESCRTPLQDMGALHDYFGPYAPYMDTNSDLDLDLDLQCIHLLRCNSCGSDVHWTVQTGASAHE